MHVFRGDPLSDQWAKNALPASINLFKLRHPQIGRNGLQTGLRCTLNKCLLLAHFLRSHNVRFTCIEAGLRCILDRSLLLAQSGKKCGTTIPSVVDPKQSFTSHLPDVSNPDVSNADQVTVHNASSDLLPKQSRSLDPSMPYIDIILL